MSSSLHLSSEEARSRLRATVATMGREISRLPRTAPGSESSRGADALRDSFADLSGQLDLGPEPEVRQCPICRHTARRDATRCGYCWTSLAALD